MNPWIGILGLAAAIGGVAWYGHKQISRLENFTSRMDAGVRATTVGQQYLQIAHPTSFWKN